MAFCPNPKIASFLVQRDLTERGRKIEQVLHQYTTLVKPAFDEFCFQTKKYADIIIPRGAENSVAIELLVQRVHEILRSPRSSSSNSLDSVEERKISDIENKTPGANGDAQLISVHPH